MFGISDVCLGSKFQPPLAFDLPKFQHEFRTLQWSIITATNNEWKSLRASYGLVPSRWESSNSLSFLRFLSFLIQTWCILGFHRQAQAPLFCFSFGSRLVRVRYEAAIVRRCLKKERSVWPPKDCRDEAQQWWRYRICKLDGWTKHDPTGCS